MSWPVIWPTLSENKNSLNRREKTDVIGFDL